MNPLSQFHYFTKPQLRGVIALIILIVIVAVAPRLYFYFYPPVFPDGAAFRNEVLAFQKSLEEVNKQEEEHDYNPFEPDRYESKSGSGKPQPKLFHFNPNEITEKDWMLLGFTQKQAAAIERAKSKGFKFKKAEDLAKVYVIGNSGYERLKDYVVIPTETIVRQPRTETAKNETAPKTPFKINLNTADTIELMKLKGIGPSFARRIFKYRELLGGFYSVEQLKEVWGFPDSTYHKILPFVMVEEQQIKTISINQDSLEVFGKHPYIKFPAAKLLMAYRAQHGKFSNIENAQKAMALSDSAFYKIKPYLRLD